MTLPSRGMPSDGVKKDVMSRSKLFMRVAPLTSARPCARNEYQSFRAPVGLSTKYVYPVKAELTPMVGGSPPEAIFNAPEGNR